MKERFLIIGTAVWLITAALLLVFESDLANALWILVYLVLLAALVFGLVLLVIAAFRLRRSPLAAGICMLLIAGGITFCCTGGVAWGERTRFALVRSSYERQLQAILDSFEHGVPMKSHLPDYQIEPGPPVRVAFMWQVISPPDNWVGLVYDPTGEVMKTNAFKPDWSNWDDPALAPIKGLFGGDIVHARHLKDHWYLCTFT